MKNPERNLEIHRRWKNGHKKAALAREYGVTPAAINQLCNTIEHKKKRFANSGNPDFLFDLSLFAGKMLWGPLRKKFVKPRDRWTLNCSAENLEIFDFEEGMKMRKNYMSGEKTKRLFMILYERNRDRRRQGLLKRIEMYEQPCDEKGESFGRGGRKALLGLFC